MTDRRHIAIDTEDDSNGAVTIINFYDGTKHYTFTKTKLGDSLREIAWAKLEALSPCYLWACNAEYDLINLCGLWVGKMVTLQYVSGGLLRGSFRDFQVTVLDTLRHWPMSVAQMGKYLGLPKLDQDFVKKRPENMCPHGVLQSALCMSCVKYCRRDTEIVWHFVDRMLAQYAALGLTLRATLPSMALQLFTQRFHTESLVRLPFHTTHWMRGGYYGGRVEVYRFGQVNGPVNHYDVNSLFPSVMVSGEYPDPRTWKRSRRMDLSREGIAHVLVRVPETEYPGLPMRGEEDIVYPYGLLTGRWCYPELRQLLHDGGTIERVYEVVEFAARPTPFKEYIEFCYAERLKAAKDSLESVLWKLYMNSLYGKFAQNRGLQMIYDDKSLTLDTTPGPAANVVWSAYVTSYARLRLLAFLRQCSTVYYTDTDSLFTPDVLSTSTLLGELKHEGTYDQMECFGNKMYAYTRGGVQCMQLMLDAWNAGEDVVTVEQEISKAKGVPQNVARDFIRMGRAIYRKPARLRESRRSLAIANRWYEVEKKREAVYTKRERLPDGATRPWRWDHYLAYQESRA